jgi:hypothetical protein
VKILARVGRWLILGLWPLLFGLSVAVGSGRGWGAVEAVALCAWWVPALIFRKVTWPLRHQHLAFAHLVYVFSTLFFAFLAGVPLHVVTRWPTWVCVLVAPLIGVAVTVVMWPAQRRFYATKLALLEANKRLMSNGTPVMGRDLHG